VIFRCGASPLSIERRLQFAYQSMAFHMLQQVGSISAHRGISSSAPCPTPSKTSRFAAFVWATLGGVALSIGKKSNHDL